MNLRLATPHDGAACADIYAPYVTDTVISFEMDPPTAVEMATRIENSLLWLVGEEEGRVHGYAYAGPHRERPAYRWSVDVSVYIRSTGHRKGLGRALYTELFERLKARNYCRAFAGLTLPNPASEGLHRALGFEPVGVYHRVGYKFGRWHDVAWYERDLLPPTDGPLKDPVPLTRQQ